MDQHDAEILRLLQKNSRRSAEALAEEVGLSASAVQKRLGRLRASDIFDRECAILAPGAAGFSLFQVRVRLTRGRRDAIGQFRRLVVQTPEIMQCFHVTGECDFVLLVAVRSIEDYEAFCSRLFVDENNVAGFETNVILRPVKYGLELPI